MGAALSVSERDWLAVRRRLVRQRHQLGVLAAAEYPDADRVTGTPLLARPRWLPGQPIPLDAVDLTLRPDAGRAGPIWLDGTGPAAGQVLPVRADGSRYPRYSAAMAALAAPSVFQDRRTYRLLDADLAGPRGRLDVGRGRYFDGIDTGEACAHEYAAGGAGPLRAAIGDPLDPASRPVNLAISTLTLRRDPAGGHGFPLHWRDPARVGHAGGLFQVVPVGVFQPSGDQPWHEHNDCSLWLGMVREYAEELRGEPERCDGQAPIDYAAWPFAARMERARHTGELRAYCLGLGVDPLTLATDLLTVVVIDAPVYDELFGAMIETNSEGRLLGDGTRPWHPFTAATVERFAAAEPMQAAGVALLRLADANRDVLLD